MSHCSLYKCFWSNKRNDLFYSNIIHEYLLEVAGKEAIRSKKGWLEKMSTNFHGTLIKKFITVVYVMRKVQIVMCKPQIQALH